MKNDNAVQHNNQTASEQTLSPDEGHVLHKVRDPVCGMAILPDRAHSSIRYQDHQLYFCSASCESKFKAHPDRYLTEDASEHSHHHHHDHHEVSPDQIKQPHNQGKRTARTVLTGMCYSVGSVMRQGSSSLTRLTGQSAMTSRTWRR